MQTLRGAVAIQEQACFVVATLSIVLYVGWAQGAAPLVQEGLPFPQLSCCILV